MAHASFAWRREAWGARYASKRAHQNDTCGPGPASVHFSSTGQPHLAFGSTARSSSRTHRTSHSISSSPPPPCHRCPWLPPTTGVHRASDSVCSGAFRLQLLSLFSLFLTWSLSEPISITSNIVLFFLKPSENPHLMYSDCFDCHCHQPNIHLSLSIHLFVWKHGNMGCQPAMANRKPLPLSVYLFFGSVVYMCFCIFWLLNFRPLNLLLLVADILCILGNVSSSHS